MNFTDLFGVIALATALHGADHHFHLLLEALDHIDRSIRVS